MVQLQQNAGLLNLGIIGLDTSHAVSFTRILNDPDHEYHVQGGRVVAAFPGGSPDFEKSITRVEGFTNQMRDDFGVAIMDTPEAVAEASDAILILSGDGRVHAEQFGKIAAYGKPVFIDKPLAVSTADARRIFRLAEEHRIPVLSSSALRYSVALDQALANQESGKLLGADVYGPMPIEPTQPGFFWYGIHAIEILYKIMGIGCTQVYTATSEDHDVIVGHWKEGRIGTVRGSRVSPYNYGGLIHREKGTASFDVNTHPKPRYASELDVIMDMFHHGRVQVEKTETLEIIRFIEAANESRETGMPVIL